MGMGKKLFLDTKGTCFLCLREVEGELEEIASSDGGNHGGASDRAVGVCLRNICRYLKISPSSILLKMLKDKQEKGQDMGNGASAYQSWRDKCDFSVTLCATCSYLTENISDLISQIEAIKIVMTHQLQVFHRIVRDSSMDNQEEEEKADGCQSLWRNLKRKMMSGEGGDGSSDPENEETRLVKMLRLETEEKCAAKVKILVTTSFPRLRLHRLNEEVILNDDNLKEKAASPIKTTQWTYTLESGGCSQSSSSLKGILVRRKDNIKQTIIWKCQKQNGGCGRTFSNKLTLKAHKNKRNCSSEMWNKIKVWLCSIEDGGCGYEFSRRSHLHQHRMKACPIINKKSWTCSTPEGGCRQKFLTVKGPHGLYQHQLRNCSKRMDKDKRLTLDPSIVKQEFGITIKEEKEGSSEVPTPSNEFSLNLGVNTSMQISSCAALQEQQNINQQFSPKLTNNTGQSYDKEKGEDVKPSILTLFPFVSSSNQKFNEQLRQSDNRKVPEIPDSNAMFGISSFLSELAQESGTDSSTAVKKQWKCSVEDGGCGRTLSSKESLRRHKKEHCSKTKIQKKSWKCSSENGGGCNRSFSLKGGLTRHKKICSGKKKNKENIAQEEEEVPQQKAGFPVTTAAESEPTPPPPPQVIMEVGDEQQMNEHIFGRENDENAVFNGINALQQDKMDFSSANGFSSGRLAYHHQPRNPVGPAINWPEEIQRNRVFPFREYNHQNQIYEIGGGGGNISSQSYPYQMENGQSWLPNSYQNFVPTDDHNPNDFGLTAPPVPDSGFYSYYDDPTVPPATPGSGVFEGGRNYTNQFTNYSRGWNSNNFNFH